MTTRPRRAAPVHRARRSACSACVGARVGAVAGIARAPLVVLASASCVNFFRDPERVAAGGRAAGRRRPPTARWSRSPTSSARSGSSSGRATRVSIFMSPLERAREPHPGRRHASCRCSTRRASSTPPSLDKASLDNEQNAVVVEERRGERYPVRADRRRSWPAGSSARRGRRSRASAASATA